MSFSLLFFFMLHSSETSKNQQFSEGVMSAMGVLANIFYAHLLVIMLKHYGLERIFFPVLPCALAIKPAASFW